MSTNVGFDEAGLPFLEEGADEGRIVQVGDRLAVEPIPTSGTVFTLDRSVNDGQTWEPVLGETPSESGANLVDWESLSYGDNLYRAIAQTVEGATSATMITVPARSGALWLSGGPGFALTCRLPFNPGIGFSSSRATATRHYAGRTRPVVDKGQAVDDVAQVSGTVEDRANREHVASPDALRALFQAEEPLHLLRTPDVGRMYGAVSGGDVTRQIAAGSDDPLRPWNGIWGYSFALTEATEV